MDAHDNHVVVITLGLKQDLFRRIAPLYQDVFDIETTGIVLSGNVFTKLGQAGLDGGNGFLLMALPYLLPLICPQIV